MATFGTVREVAGAREVVRIGELSYHAFSNHAGSDYVFRFEYGFQAMR